VALLFSSAISEAHAGETRTVGGTIAENTVWTAAGGPLVVTSNVRVPAGVRLEIEAGTQVLIEPEVEIEVRGELIALGTAEAPILFTASDPSELWDAIELLGETARGELEYCEITLADGDPGAITLEDATLVVTSCHIHDIDGEGIHTEGGDVTVRHTLVEHTREALSLDEGRAVVEHCTLRFVHGNSDLCDINDSRDPPARFAFNHIYGTEDDGLDIDNSDIEAEGNVIHGCGDQAFSLVGNGTARIVGNLVYGNTHGLSVKDGYVCVAEHNTFANHFETGVRAIEEDEGDGGGQVTLANSIVWGNGVSLFTNSTGTIVTSNSCIEGLTSPGEGDFEEDPLFVDSTVGDYRLQDASPCIGRAGDGSDLGARVFEDESHGRLVTRGDVNDDGVEDLSDAIRILLHLFASHSLAVCNDAADANDDGALDIADASFLLSYLFKDGPAPLPRQARCVVGE